jgi:hypothetical protein
MKRKILFILLVLITTTSSSAQVLYIMKTNYGGCSNYSLPTPYYGGATTSFSYNISSDDGIWLCPIREVGPYLIFDKKPSSYTLDYETYTDYNQTDIYELLASLVVTITKDCETTIGYGASNLRPYFELISNQVLTSPGVNNVLTDKIKLKATGCSGTQRFHWEYKLNGSQFQKMNISTSFNEEFEFITANFIPLDYTGFIDFRVVIDSDPSITEENVYSNIISYNVTRKAPEIISTSSPNFTSCSYSQDGAVTFTFERELQDGEQYEMALFYQNGAAVLDGNKTITKNSMTTPTTYTWTNLPSENYKLTYYTKKTVGSEEYLSNPPLQKSFTISSPSLFSFSATETQPKCYGEKGTIIITASGGTPPYYYYLNDDPKIEFTSPKTIDANAGDNYIKVVDSKSCIDNIKEDEKI